ncbi:hypothetical protein [Tepidibacter hydrothermalis]|uniref:Uncharacterized protein n=1 Tax=Tepidibacter hydrothermalis TaxID=3036126 RepID=A0ABY8EJM5_9FIRM|nr:hypothetical protein [Tepidibacter hydrothermalis]WFD12019.1 hypothetical protein P4S50_08055 [Tepidibacter hydrothermalis]
MNIKIEIENGNVYEVIETKKSKEKRFKCMEYTLVSNVEIKRIENKTTVIGIVYKQNYKGEVIEITDNLILKIEDKLIELAPNGGMSDIDIEINNVDLERIFIKEKDNENISGVIVLKEEVLNG